MSTRLTTITPHTTVEEALRLVNEFNCRHLPVVENDKVLGMISIRDLTTALVEARDREIAQLNEYIAGGYGAPGG